MKGLVSYVQAIGYALLGFTVWVVGDACVKLAGQTSAPVYQIVFVSCLAAITTMLVLTAWRGRLAALRPRRVKLELFRSALRIGHVFASVFAFTHLPLTTVYVAVFLAPMLISFMAAIFMRERLSWRQITAILTGFIGVVVAIDPASVDLSGGNVIGYVALPFCLLFFSAGMFLLRFMSRSETDESMVLFPQVAMAAALLPFCLWHYEPMSFAQYSFVSGFGVFAVLGWVAMNIAFRHAPAAVVSPFHYSQIISGAILGYFVWGDVPTWNLAVGAAVIIASGLYIGHRARRGEVAERGVEGVV